MGKQNGVIQKVDHPVLLVICDKFSLSLWRLALGRGMLAKWLWQKERPEQQRLHRVVSLIYLVKIIKPKTHGQYDEYKQADGAFEFGHVVKLKNKVSRS